MNFSICQWRAWAPGMDTHHAWNDWVHAPTPIIDEQQSPDVSFLPAIQRRRLSRLARMVFHCAWPLAEQYGQLPLIFASRHGETPRTLSILQTLGRNEPVSPTQFSLSVHNAIIGLWSILRADNSEMLAIAAQGDGLEHAVLEAVTLLNEGEQAVLLVIAEETPPTLYQPFIDDVPFPYALALLLEPGQTWQLTHSKGEGYPSARPHAIDLISALCTEQHVLTHYWDSRQWTWLQHKK